MPVVEPSLSFSDFLPILVVMLGTSALIFLITSFYHDVLNRSEILGSMIVGALTVGAIVAAALLPSRLIELRDEIASSFEVAYDLSIVDDGGRPPFTENDTPKAMIVYLNDIPGPQTVVVDIVNGMYHVTHNGIERDVVND